MIENLLHFFQDIDRVSIFWFFALGGSSFFAIQLIFNLFGLSEGSDFEIENGSSVVSDVWKFKSLSFQTFTGFFMIFGWTGVACLIEFELSAASTLFLATAAGMLTVWINRSIYNMIAKSLKRG